MRLHPLISTIAMMACLALMTTAAQAEVSRVELHPIQTQTLNFLAGPLVVSR